MWGCENKWVWNKQKRERDMRVTDVGVFIYKNDPTKLWWYSNLKTNRRVVVSKFKGYGWKIIVIVLYYECFSFLIGRNFYLFIFNSCLTSPKLVIFFFFSLFFSILTSLFFVFYFLNSRFPYSYSLIWDPTFFFFSNQFFFI